MCAYVCVCTCLCVCFCSVYRTVVLPLKVVVLCSCCQAGDAQRRAGQSQLHKTPAQCGAAAAVQDRRAGEDCSRAQAPAGRAGKSRTDTPELPGNTRIHTRVTRTRMIHTRVTRTHLSHVDTPTNTRVTRTHTHTHPCHKDTPACTSGSDVWNCLHAWVTQTHLHARVTQTHECIFADRCCVSIQLPEWLWVFIPVNLEIVILLELNRAFIWTAHCSKLLLVASVRWEHRRFSANGFRFQKRLDCVVH